MQVSHFSTLPVAVEAYPKPLHHFCLIDAEFLGIFYGKLTDSESPTVQTGPESDSTPCLDRPGRHPRDLSKYVATMTLTDSMVREKDW